MNWTQYEGEEKVELMPVKSRLDVKDFGSLNNNGGLNRALFWRDVPRPIEQEKLATAKN